MLTKIPAAMAEVMTPEMLAPMATGMIMAKGFFLQGRVLCQLSGGGDAGDAGDARHRIEVLIFPLVDPVHQKAAQQAAHGGDGQRQDPQDQNDQYGGIQDGGCLAQDAQNDAQEEGGKVGKPLFQQLCVAVDLRLFDGPCR